MALSEIKVNVEFSADDRALLDTLNANLEKVINLISPTTINTVGTPFPATVPTEAPKKPQEAPAPDTQEKSQPEPETATEPVQPESYDVLAPQYTVDDVRQKEVCTWEQIRSLTIPVTPPRAGPFREGSPPHGRCGAVPSRPGTSQKESFSCPPANRSCAIRGHLPIGFIVLPTGIIVAYRTEIVNGLFEKYLQCQYHVV